MDWNGCIYDPPIYYFGQESLRRNAVAIIDNKSVRNAVLGGSFKNDRMISVHFQSKPFSITVIQVYAPTSNTEEAEVEQFYEDLQILLERTHPPKRCPFHYRGLECKSWKSRNTLSNRQIWPWSIEWSRAKANRVLPRESTGHSSKDNKYTITINGDKCFDLYRQNAQEKFIYPNLLITPKPLTAFHNKLWKIFQEMGIPDHLTCILRNLYAGQEPDIGTTDWFQIKEYIKAYIVTLLFNLYSEWK